MFLEFFFRGFIFGQNAKGEGGGGVRVLPKSLEHFFQDFYHFRLSKSAGIWNFFQMSTTFLEANNIKIYAVLSHVAKSRNLHVKVLRDCPKKGRGGDCLYLDFI